jgi:hypothetical protein
MYCVKTKNKTKKTVGLNQWFFHANPGSNWQTFNTAS